MEILCFTVIKLFLQQPFCVEYICLYEYKTKLIFHRKFGILNKYLQFNTRRTYKEVLIMDRINHIESSGVFSHAE